MQTNLLLPLIFSALLLAASSEKGSAGLRRNLKKYDYDDDDDDDWYDDYYDESYYGGVGTDFSIQRNQEQQQHPCLPFSSVPPDILKNPDTHSECRVEGGCRAGCCRLHLNAECIAFQPPTRENPGSTYLQCICNGNTGAPEDFGGALNGNPSIAVEPPTNENPSFVVIDAAETPPRNPSIVVEPPTVDENPSFMVVAETPVAETPVETPVDFILAPVIPDDPPVATADNSANTGSDQQPETPQTIFSEFSVSTTQSEQSISTRGERCNQIYDMLEGIGDRCESNDDCEMSGYCCTKNFCVCANVGGARNHCM